MAKRERSEDDKIVRELKKRFKRCQDWESVARARMLSDIRFVNGDSDNLFQWSDSIRDSRIQEDRPMLTINKTRQHCLNILNDARQNKSSISIKPTGGGASFESAQVYEGVVRHIEYISKAQDAYQHGLKYAVYSGIGYWRITTDYADDESFDQDIFIKRVRDPFSVYLDPDITEADGSDARFGIIFDDMPRDAYEAAYPDFKELASASAIDGDDGWITEDTVRVAEYFRIVPDRSKSDRLVSFTDPVTGQPVLERASALREVMEEAAFKAVIDSPMTRVRDIPGQKVEWFVISSNHIIERRDWVGSYIPIIRCVGEESIIEGQLDRKGHVRALKDPNRMYNYNASAAVEFGALQSKTPYIGAVEGISGYETYWNSANRINHAWLPYRALDDNGNPIPRPERQTPPVAAPVFQQGMQNAAADMMLVSGQFEADFGQQGNERSGVAIQQRQRAGDNATYHFIDNQAAAIRYTGRQLIDLIPRIYDTPRILNILGEDGSQTAVQIDPNAPQALVEEKTAIDKVEAIFNPNIGKYAVESDIGPAYATKRQEAFNAFSQIATGNQELMMLIGDLMFQNADFPGADKIAERMRRLLPPQVTGEGQDAQVQQLMAQLEQMQGLLTAMAQKLADKQADIETDRIQKGIDAARAEIQAYDAETKRLAALQKVLPLDQEGLAQLVRKEIVEALRSPDAFSAAGMAAQSVPEFEGEPLPVTDPVQEVA